MAARRVRRLASAIGNRAMGRMPARSSSLEDLDASQAVHPGQINLTEADETTNPQLRRQPRPGHRLAHQPGGYYLYIKDCDTPIFVADDHA